MGECAEIHQAGAYIRTFHLLGGTGQAGFIFFGMEEVEGRTNARDTFNFPIAEVSEIKWRWLNRQSDQIGYHLEHAACGGW